MSQAPFELRAEDVAVDHASILGSGSFGCVFAGALRDGTRIAAKSLHFIRIPEMWELCFGAHAVDGAGNWLRFLRDIDAELAAMATLRHPRLVALLGVVWAENHGVADGDRVLRAPLYIVMERAAASLERRLAEAAAGGGALLVPRVAVRLIADAAEGLAGARALGGGVCVCACVCAARMRESSTRGRA